MQNKKEQKHIGQKPLLNEFEEGELDKRPKGMPPLCDIQTEVARHGLASSDAQDIYDHWLMNGFKTGRGVAIKNWKAAIRVWKANEWFPSQKKNGAKLRDAAKERDAATFERMRRDRDHR
jgi:molecular chaperone DnaK (HSP70)